MFGLPKLLLKFSIKICFDKIIKIILSFSNLDVKNGMLESRKSVRKQLEQESSNKGRPNGRNILKTSKITKDLFHSSVTVPSKPPAISENLSLFSLETIDSFDDKLEKPSISSATNESTQNTKRQRSRFSNNNRKQQLFSARPFTTSNNRTKIISENNDEISDNKVSGDNVPVSSKKYLLTNSNDNV